MNDREKEYQARPPIPSALRYRKHKVLLNLVFPKTVEWQESMAIFKEPKRILYASVAERGIPCRKVEQGGLRLTVAKWTKQPKGPTMKMDTVLAI